MSGENKEKEASELAERLGEIRSLEKKLIGLKRMLIESGAISSDETASGDEATFLLLHVAQKYFALPVALVDEVCQMASIGTLAEDIWGILGLVNYHGKLITVVDLSTVVGLGAGTVDPTKTLVICSLEPFTFGLMVDEAVDVVSLARDEIKVTDEILPGMLKDMGVIRFSGQNAVIIDLWSMILSIQVVKMNNADSKAPLLNTGDNGDRS